MAHPTPAGSHSPRLTPVPAGERGAAPLPTPLTRCLGREQDIDAVGALLRQADIRLLTLTGPGGVGKTRLAIEVARTVERDFADGLCFVALDSIRDAALVLPAIAKALGIAEQTGQAVLDTLVTRLRDRHLLLVLDNFEHLLAEAPTWLVEVLGACPRLTALVTSRTALNIGGEQRFVVSPLSVPGSDADAVDEVSGATAVMLFAQRARAIRADFSLSADNAASVGAICRKLDGLPLAIELAAARVDVLPPEEMLSHLADRFRLLAGGQRGAPALAARRDRLELRSPPG